ncbi:cupin domain-containing protein [Aquibacillus albus]|uniref:Oxalate decarboxylase/phosphoglucose isomerase-like protein (Cupin superfamily) n=1 Tax=Aquibacillus albus TaxID=1168171 RepID=A0ABS2MZM4_9BACI|nr:cupin domain-containing protein [Aquibacillus albus]MBM7571355.1 oxalate decarboxylase/phosphoglucose isomerase-like protein (cupin superfamily) [Aquibacillus albus]
MSNNGGFVTGNKNIKKSSGTPNLSFEIEKNILFKRNNKNIAYEVSSTQLPAMLGGSLVDLFMTKGHIREPHWHPNAWELDVGVSGKAITSILDPDTLQLHHYEVTPGKVVFIPMGWFHWITPITKEVHLHLFFDNDQVENAELSDVFRFTPPQVYTEAYNINGKKLGEIVAPIDESVVIGPPDSDGHDNHDHHKDHKDHGPHKDHDHHHDRHHGHGGHYGYDDYNTNK